MCYLGDFGDNLAWWVQCRLWNQIVLCDLGKGLYLSWPQFSPLQNGNTNSNELGSVKICQVPWPLLMHPKKVGDRHLLNEQCYLIEKTDTDIEKCVSVCVFKICIELQHLTFPKISVSLTLLVVMQTV